jgi:hypothetical protein
MKNQYMGDIGDFAKYYLLRQLADNGLKIGVNWYLNDRGDGSLTEYLSEQSEEQGIDEKLFPVLKEIVLGDKRKVSSIESSNLISNALYYAEPIPNDNGDSRIKWFENSLEKLRGVDILFFDPDNGLVPEGAKKYAKYVLYEEIDKAYNEREKTIILYQHMVRHLGDLPTMLESIVNKIKTQAHIKADTFITVYYAGKIQPRFFIILWRNELRKKIGEETLQKISMGIGKYKNGLTLFEPYAVI